MLCYVTGGLGAGKSFYAARKIADALLKGRVVATNVELVDGWEGEILRHALYYRLASADKKRRYVEDIRRRYAYEPDVERLISARLYGSGENRGLRILDEAHNELNNREWLDNNQKKSLRKMTLSRKRGWESYILAQHSNNTDAAMRRIASIEIRLVNYRKYLYWPKFRSPILPFNLFLAQAFPTNVPANVKSASRPLFREMYLLGWQRRIYDTFQDYDPPEDEDSEPALWLPRRGGAAPGACSLPGAVPARSENGSGEPSQAVAVLKATETDGAD